MSKHDDYLTEVVYQIDDLIYEFYVKSNELIATKRNTDELLDFRDETISTLNDMNVRALEIIASFKKEDLVEERAKILIKRNDDILDSAFNVIENTPTKGEFFNEMKSATKDAFDYTSEKFAEFQESEAFENVKQFTAKGYLKLRDAIKNVTNNPHIKEGFETVKDKSTETFKKGDEMVKGWMHDIKDGAKEAEEFAEDKAETVKEDLEDFKEEAEDFASEKVDDIQEELHELKKDAESFVEKTGEDAAKEYEEKKEEFQELKDKIEKTAESKEKDLEKEIEEIEETLKDLGLQKGDD